VAGDEMDVILEIEGDKPYETLDSGKQTEGCKGEVGGRMG